MADPWDAYLKFDDQGRVEIIDRNLVLKIQQSIDAHKQKLTMWYWSDTGPKHEVNALCVCRTHKSK
jgi:hypothetical protein